MPAMPAPIASAPATSTARDMDARLATMSATPDARMAITMERINSSTRYQIGTCTLGLTPEVRCGRAGNRFLDRRGREHVRRKHQAHQRRRHHRRDEDHDHGGGKHIRAD